MMSFQLRHRYYVTKLTSQDFPFWAPPNQKFWFRQWNALVNNKRQKLACLHDQNKSGFCKGSAFIQPIRAI